MFKNPFTFKGRIIRTEYAISVFSLAILVLFIMITNLITSAIFSFKVFVVNGESTTNTIADFLLYILIIAYYWQLIAQGAKRCHDRGNSGWFQLIPFYALWMAFADSEYGINDYGPNPKGIGNKGNEKKPTEQSKDL